MAVFALHIQHKMFSVADQLLMSRLAHWDWEQAVNRAKKRYGDHGPLISGVYRAHFPERVKVRLRSFVEEENRYSRLAYARTPDKTRRKTVIRMDRMLKALFDSQTTTRPPNVRIVGSAEVSPSGCILDASGLPVLQGKAF